MNDLDLVEQKMRIDAMNNTLYAVHITRRWLGAKLLFWHVVAMARSVAIRSWNY